MNEKKKHSLKNKWGLTRGFILASGSPQRLRLLQVAGFYPDSVVSADIDESPLPGELPARYVHHIATLKARAVAAQHPRQCILAADTVIAVGKRLIRKADTPEQALNNLTMLSGRRHRVMTGFCVIAPNGHETTRVVQTAVILKRLDKVEIDTILSSDEWRGVAGYRIEGLLSACVTKMIGSHPNVVGLPVFEVAQVLKGILR